MSENTPNNVPGAPQGGAPVSAPDNPPASSGVSSAASSAKGSARPSVADKKRARAATSSPEAEAASRPQIKVTKGAGFNRRKAEEPQEDAPKEGEVKPPKKGFVLKVVLLSLLALVIALVAGYSCLRWSFAQDEQDIQGTWAMADAVNPVVITDSYIDLAGSASYEYSLDTQAKVISAAFSGKEGRSHYRFSRDRSSVAIIEGEPLDWVSTLQQDLAWGWDDFVASLSGQPLDPLGSSSGIVLHRIA